jgi:hypothetical protein
MNVNERKRLWRAKTQNAATKKYERTKPGKLMRIYRNMQSRIRGVQKHKAHLYKGKALLPKSEFYEWALASPVFHLLFSEWEAAGHDRKLSPTVDRIDPELGYEISNMEWVTHSENSRRGGKYRPSQALTNSRMVK